MQPYGSILHRGHGAAVQVSEMYSCRRARLRRWLFLTRSVEQASGHVSLLEFGVDMIPACLEILVEP